MNECPPLDEIVLKAVRGTRGLNTKDIRDAVRKVRPELTDDVIDACRDQLVTLEYLSLEGSAFVVGPKGRRHQ